MKLSLNYAVSANKVLRDAGFKEKMQWMRDAGVGTLWLAGYFHGHMDAPLEDIARARGVLLDNGFDVQAINVPLGHGGNAMDPNDPTVDLSIGRGWRLTVGPDGKERYNTTCVDGRVIADTLAVVLALRDMGVTRVFYDDDLRLGHWGRELQGCFCSRCLEEFSGLAGREVTRGEIITAGDPELAERWMDFTCGKLTDFLTGITPGGITSGVMVMHNGDRRHGIDIARMRKALPGTLFRVGEGHFGDASYEHPDARQALLASIHTHMARAGGQKYCYSESTIYPMGALTPANWISKMRLEIGAGLRNLFLMGGSAFITEEYWRALAKELPALRALADATPEPEHRVTEFIWQI